MPHFHKDSPGLTNSLSNLLESKPLSKPWAAITCKYHKNFSPSKPAFKDSVNSFLASSADCSETIFNSTLWSLEYLSITSLTVILSEPILMVSGNSLGLGLVAIESTALPTSSNLEISNT